jgi:hypothetical protein
MANPVPDRAKDPKRQVGDAPTTPVEAQKAIDDITNHIMNFSKSSKPRKKK